MSNSIWITIALYPGCVQGFFLAFVLWQKKEANRAAVGYLVALLLMMALLMLLRVTYQPSFLWRFAEIVLLPDIILFLTGPLIFLMLKALLHLERLPTLRMVLHFLPAAFHALVLNTVLGLHLSGYFHFLSNATLILAFYLIELGGIISLNPVAGQARLSFVLPAADAVTLRLFDALGREVATLLDNQPLPAGPYEAPLDGAALAPGRYFLRMNVQSGGFLCQPVYIQ